MKNRLFLVVAVLAVLTVSTIPVTAKEEPSWHRFTHNVSIPSQEFPNPRKWSGRLIRTAGPIEYWELESGLMMKSEIQLNQMTMEAFVILRLRWNTNTKKGVIYQVIHQGEWLSFIGWRGTVELVQPLETSINEEVRVDGSYFYFRIGGMGIGSYGPDSRFGNAFIRGNWEIYWYPYEGNSFVDGMPTFYHGMTEETIASRVLFYGLMQKPGMG